MLYAVSLDGTLGAFAFDKEEFDGILPFSAQEEYLKKFAFRPAPLPTGYVHPPRLDEAVNGVHLPSRAQSQAAPQSTPGEIVNKLVAKRKDKTKKRLPLSSSIPSSAVPASRSGLGGEIPRPSPLAASTARGPLASPRFPNAGGGSSAGASTELEQEFLAWRKQKLAAERAPVTTDGFGFDAMDIEPIGGVEPSVTVLDSMSPLAKGKRKTTDDDGKAVKARTLGGDRARETGPAKELAGRAGPSSLSPWDGVAEILPVPALLTVLTSKLDNGDTLEGSNPEDGGKS